MVVTNLVMDGDSHSTGATAQLKYESIDVGMDLSLLAAFSFRIIWQIPHANDLGIMHRSRITTHNAVEEEERVVLVRPNC